MLGLFRKNAAAGGFWDWLAANTTRIQPGLKQNPQGLGEEIGRAFKRSYPDLSWEISPTPSPPWLFCVSADGNGKLFPKVTQAIREAPELPGWKVQAFRPRGALTAEIDLGGHTLGYEDVWCSPGALPGGVRVTLWIRGLDPQADQVLSRAALILLDNAVGEYDAVMKIKQLDCGPLQPNPRRTDSFFPLHELPRYLDHLQVS
jgi:hypothetical protein